MIAKSNSYRVFSWVSRALLVDGQRGSRCGPVEPESRRLRNNSICEYWCTCTRLGSHAYSVNQYGHVGSVMYGICAFFIKAPISLQYLEVFVPAKKSNIRYWASHLLIWLNFVFYAISTFFEIFACSPVAEVWNILITEGSCLNTLVLYIAASSINSVSDLIILVPLQVMIWGL